MPVFDPSQVNMDAAAGDQTPDFMQQAATLARQQKMADLLRKIALESRNQPAGQMVSGHYVPTSALEKLLPALDIYKAKQAETQAAGTEASNNAAMQAHANQWRQSAFPQALAARPEQMGPVDPSTGSPELTAQPAQPVTLGQVLKKTLSAGDNPLLKNQAAAYEKYGTAEVAREDTQQQQKDLLAQNQVVAREKLAEEARRHQDQMAIAAQSDQRAREMQQLSLQMQQQGQTNTAAYRTLMAQIAQQNADTRAAAVDKKGTTEKPLPVAIATAFVNNNAAASQVDKAMKLAEDNPDAFGLTKGMLPQAIISRTDPKGNEARAAVADLGSLRIHDRTGAAMTAREEPRLIPFIPSPTDNAETVKTKLRGFRRNYDAIQNEIADLAENQGYKSPRSLIRSTPNQGATGGWGKAEAQ